MPIWFVPNAPPSANFFGGFHEFLKVNLRPWVTHTCDFNQRFSAADHPCAPSKNLVKPILFDKAKQTEHPRQRNRSFEVGRPFQCKYARIRRVNIPRWPCLGSFQPQKSSKQEAKKAYSMIVAKKAKKLQVICKRNQRAKRSLSSRA